MNDKDRPMPPLIAFAGALGGLAVVRWAYRTAQRVNRELEEARRSRLAEAARSGEIPTLRRGPNTGAYRPGCGTPQASCTRGRTCAHRGRRRFFSAVSKDGGIGALMVRDARRRAPHHEEHPRPKTS